jgi:hypothetical protein
MGDKMQPKSAKPIDPDQKLTRLSSRVTISIPVEIVVKDSTNKVSVEETKTLVVNAHGCRIPLQRPIEIDSKILLIHKLTHEQISCRVALCRKQSKTDYYEIGVSFEKPSPRFWRINFLPDDWDPSTRKRTVRT